MVEDQWVFHDHYHSDLKWYVHDAASSPGNNAFCGKSGKTGAQGLTGRTRNAKHHAHYGSLQRDAWGQVTT